jgi:hypothetical protein
MNGLSSIDNLFPGDILFMASRYKLEQVNFLLGVELRAKGAAGDELWEGVSGLTSREKKKTTYM